MQDNVRIPIDFFSEDEISNINEALEKLFGVSMGKVESSLVLTEAVIARILKGTPHIRKWQIAYILLREKLYEEGIKLSKDTLREVRNPKNALKDNGIDPEEVIEIFEEFIRESTDRIFKRNKKGEE